MQQSRVLRIEVPYIWGIYYTLDNSKALKFHFHINWTEGYNFLSWALQRRKQEKKQVTFLDISPRKKGQLEANVGEMTRYALCKTIVATWSSTFRRVSRSKCSVTNTLNEPLVEAIQPFISHTVKCLSSCIYKLILKAHTQKPLFSIVAFTSKINRAKLWQWAHCIAHWEERWKRIHKARTHFNKTKGKTSFFGNTCV